MASNKILIDEEFQIKFQNSMFEDFNNGVYFRRIGVILMSLRFNKSWFTISMSFIDNYATIPISQVADC